MNRTVYDVTSTVAWCCVKGNLNSPVLNWKHNNSCFPHDLDQIVPTNLAYKVTPPPLIWMFPNLFVIVPCIDAMLALGMSCTCCRVATPRSRWSQIRMCMSGQHSISYVTPHWIWACQTLYVSRAVLYTLMCNVRLELYFAVMCVGRVHL